MTKLWQVFSLIMQYQPTFAELVELFNAIKAIYNPTTIGSEVRFEVATPTQIEDACKGKSKFFTEALHVIAKD